MILYIIYYALLFAHIICVIGNRRNSVLVWLTLFVMAIMFFANDATYGDHIVYNSDFQFLQRDRDGDPLFTAYMLLINKLGITSYQVFLFTIYIFECVLIGLGIGKFTKNFHPLFALCMIYIFPFFGVGLRYSMAMAVFIFGLRYWADKKYIYAIITTIIASAFHICLATAIILLPALLKKVTDNEIINKSRLPYWPFLVIVAIFVVITYATNSFMLKDYLAMLMNEYFDERGLGYLETEIGNGIVIMLPAYVFSFLLSHNMLLSNRRCELDGNVNVEFSKLTKFNYVINVLSGVFYVLFCVTPSYLRLLVVPAVLNAAVFGVFLDMNRTYNFVPRRTQRSTVFYFCCLVVSWVIPIYFHMFNIGANQWIETTLRYFN